VYVSRTYGAMIPFLKGMHLTLDTWRPNWDEDGWQNTSTFKRKCKIEEREKPRRFVKMVPRLQQDIEVLVEFTEAKKPMRVLV
jgi:hypothetical protein